jgi:hypothetical protein
MTEVPTVPTTTLVTRASSLPAEPAEPAGPPVSSPPVAFATRQPYPNCGEDVSLSLDANGPPGRERRCLLAANAAGKPAELDAREIGSSFGGSAHVVYRTAPDRSLEVYVVGNPWQLVRCQGLQVDDRRVFTAVGCDAPVVLD